MGKINNVSAATLNLWGLEPELKWELKTIYGKRVQMSLIQSREDLHLNQRFRIPFNTSVLIYVLYCH